MQIIQLIILILENWVKYRKKQKEKSKTLVNRTLHHCSHIYILNSLLWCRASPFTQQNHPAGVDSLQKNGQTSNGWVSRGLWSRMASSLALGKMAQQICQGIVWIRERKEFQKSRHEEDGEREKKTFMDFFFMPWMV